MKLKFGKYVSDLSKRKELASDKKIKYSIYVPAAILMFFLT